MLKLCILACLMAIAAAVPKPDPALLAYSAPYAAYTAPVAAVYSAPYAYTAYSAYTAPAQVAYSAYPYASPYSAYFLRR